jgi:hypothetical protein
MMSLSAVYLEVYDELELGAALLLYNRGDGKLLHALQKVAHHWGAVTNGHSQMFVKKIFFVLLRTLYNLNHLWVSNWSYVL